MAPRQSEQHRINDRIRAREVRLIGPEGDQLGITPVPEALRRAKSFDLDLVEVAPQANPPVCRIMDYGKFRYEEAQKAKESRKKQTNVTVKEVKFRPKIGKGDFNTKVRKVDHFVREGHKVKVTLQFRGREVAHPELGTKILDEVLDEVGDIVKIETQARLEGRNMSMVLTPDKPAIDAAAKAAKEAEKTAAATGQSPETGQSVAETETTQETEQSSAETEPTEEAEPSSDTGGAAETPDGQTAR